MLVLVEAAGATVGPVARQAGFALNAGACTTSYCRAEEPVHSVLYEASAADFRRRFPEHNAVHDELCIDLWIHWRPASKTVDVSLLPFHGIRGLLMIGREDLVMAAAEQALDHRAVTRVLKAYAAALVDWLGI